MDDVNTLNNVENVMPKENLLINTLYHISAALMPSILLLSLYNRNRLENVIFFEHVLIFAGILGVAGLLTFIAMRWIAGSIEGALLATGAIWFLFWLFTRIYSAVVRFIPGISDVLLMILLGAGIVAAAICFRWLKPVFSTIRPAFNVLALCLIGMFVFNLTPAVYHEFVLYRARSESPGTQQGDGTHHIKHDFNVDPSLPHPNVYWFHVDGMMSAETVERFWGEDLNWLRGKLSDRGFVRYENGSINAGSTRPALPVLFSPYLYDSFFSILLDEHEDKLKADKSRALVDDLAKSGLTYNDDISPYYEMLGAFRAAGYEIVIQNMGSYMPDTLYLSNEHSSQSTPVSRAISSFYNSDFPALLSQTLPVSFRDRRGAVDSGSDNPIRIDGSGVPRLLVYSLDDTHMTQVHNFDPSAAFQDRTAIHAYPLAYKSIAEKTLHMVDSVLGNDPDAVIVIQADHGFHIMDTQLYLIEQGHSTEQVFELIYSVFSAVYIPEHYGGLDEPLHPLNVSRELVNRFVGENYELLPD